MSTEEPSKPETTGPKTTGSQPDESDWERKRRLAAVFGDVLPETTKDEREPGEAASRRSGEDATDAWLRAQVPPHHG